MKGFTSVASRGEESEKHRLENTVWSRNAVLSCAGTGTTIQFQGGSPVEGAHFEPSCQYSDNISLQKKNQRSVRGYCRLADALPPNVNKVSPDSI